MKKSVLVIGMGSFGRGVVEGLYEKGYDVFAIDKDEEYLDKVREMIVSGAVMDITEETENFTKLIGKKNFEEAVVAIGENFEGALMATHILKEADLSVSVKAPNQRRGKVLQKIGADRIIYPEQDMGRRLAAAIVEEEYMDSISLPHDKKVDAVEVKKGLNGKTIGEVNSWGSFNILMVYREEKSFSCQGELELVTGDIMIVFGTRSAMAYLRRKNH